MRTLLLIVIMLPALTFADGDCKGNHPCTNTSGGSAAADASSSSMASANNTLNNAMSVETGAITYKSDSRALALSGADMAINDYYRTYSYAFGLVQDSKINPIAVAAYYDSIGMHDAAAVMRCSITDLAKRFEKAGQDCVAMNTATVVSAAPINHSDDEYEELRDDYDELLNRLAELEQKTSVPPPAPVQRTIIEQRSYLSAEQKAALREAVQ